MKPKILLGALIASIFMVPTSAFAQSAKAEIGIYGGGSYYTAALDEDELGTDADEVRFESGWLAGGHITGWVLPRVGIRANVAYSERPLIFSDDGTFSSSDENNLAEDINLWSISGDLLLRLNDPDVSRFNPYVALGGGVKGVDPAEDGPRRFTYLGTGTTPTSYQLDTDWTAMGLVGLGADYRLARNLSFKLEAGDRIWEAPIHRETTLNNFVEEGDVVHEPYLVAGINYLIGVREQPQAVVVALAPPRRPPVVRPTPRPEPTPEPDIFVCETEYRFSAPGVPIRPLQGRPVETVYVDGERRVRLPGLTKAVPLADNMDWYVQGRPLRVQLEDTDYEFVTYGRADLVNRGNLVFLGEIDDVPVYAQRYDAPWAASLYGEDDLDDRLLRANRVEDFRRIEALYVPVDVNDCLYQMVQRVEFEVK